MIRYGYIRFSQVPERISTKSFVVLIIGNSKSNHLGAQDTDNLTLVCRKRGKYVVMFPENLNNHIDMLVGLLVVSADPRTVGADLKEEQTKLNLCVGRVESMP